jgi:hypothetical protein
LIKGHRASLPVNPKALDARFKRIPKLALKRRASREIERPHYETVCAARVALL